MAEEESEKKGKSFLRKAEREVCHKAKDQFWDCMKANKEDVGRCLNPRKEFESACPPTWVTHFDRKFKYEKFKKDMRVAEAEQNEEIKKEGQKSS